MRGSAEVACAKKVLLPALGRPTKPQSAINCNSRSSSRSSPGSPGVHSVGAWLVAETKFRFPNPPRPPLAASNRWPTSTKSANWLPWSSRTIVPTGTRTSKSSAEAPKQSRPRPCAPCAARRCGRCMRWENSFKEPSATNQTEPPRPPSPPSGPPLGTNISRRIDDEPSPPRPARQKILTRSANMDSWLQSERSTSIRIKTPYQVERQSIQSGRRPA